MTKRIRVPDSTRALVTCAKTRGGAAPFWTALVYNACFAVFALLYLPLFVWRGKHRSGWRARLGWVPAQLRQRLTGRPTVWVHGVSVGEIVQAFRLISALREKRDQTVFVITATTERGLEVARRLKDEEDVVLPFPVDLLGSVRRFTDAVAPRALVILETEIWPNLIFELSARAVPVYIVNGRISDRAIGGYRRVRPFMRTVLRRVAAIGAQDELSRSRFVELGADEARVRVTGNLKFDWQPPSPQPAVESAARAALGAGTKLFVAGSTHEGEESAILSMWPRLQRAVPGLKLVLAPRHPERCAAVEAQARRLGVPLQRLSQVGAAPGAATAMLLDTMGSLAAWYRFADAVFVGGSLVPVGGHNLVEPAYFEKPVLFGPHMENFKEMASAFASAEAGRRVGTAEELERCLIALLTDPNAAQRMGRRAKELVLRNQGATERTLETVLFTLNDRRTT